MRETPILMSAPMVRAIMERRKSQTRRIVKGQMIWKHPSGEMDLSFCPYGGPGDRLWVRETFKLRSVGFGTIYRADSPISRADVIDHAFGVWKPSIFMPKSAARIWLELTAVRVERLKEIEQNPNDILAEGYDPKTNATRGDLSWYRELWETINGPGSWSANPWVWVLTFKRIEK